MAEVYPATDVHGFQQLHQKCRREREMAVKDVLCIAVLFFTSYIHLNASQGLFYAIEQEFAASDTLLQPPFYVHGNLYYPNAILSLQSIIMIYLEEVEYTKVRNEQAKLER
jgi:hypothetical protein